MTFAQLKEKAIAEAMELNRKEGYHRWKTVSMSDTGYWFVDECLPEEMTVNHAMGIHIAPYGKDAMLDATLHNSAVCEWPDSKAEVPAE